MHKDIHIFTREVHCRGEESTTDKNFDKQGVKILKGKIESYKLKNGKTKKRISREQRTVR